LRKALFAMIMVGAAFAGGAVVNGPGLGLLKAAIQARLRPGKPAAPAPGEPARAQSPPQEVPAAPLPSLVAELRREDRASPRPVETPSGAIGVTPPPPRSEAAPAEPAPPPTETPTPALREPAKTSDPEVTTASRRLGPARDWTDLRRRMRELGVSRYEIEGEPGGRCRFRCLIPLAGRRAVGQQFEGEGDDDFQAADAALRRVSLWRASETAPP
jgi:hypothetical protein